MILEISVEKYYQKVFLKASYETKVNQTTLTDDTCSLRERNKSWTWKKTDDVTWFYVIILISSRVYSLLKKRYLDVVLTGESESLYNIKGDNNWKLLIKMKPFCSIIIALINLLFTSITFPSYSLNSAPLQRKLPN